MASITVYVALVCDRHDSPVPHLRATKEAAIEFARSEAREIARDPADIEEELHDGDGLLWSAGWSEEGDWVAVYETSLDLGPIPDLLASLGEAAG